MNKSTLTANLAHNLALAMKRKGLTQAALAGLSGVGQTTISLYLNPDRRQLSKSGKPPSPKLSEVETLARAIGIDALDLLSPALAPGNQLVASAQQPRPSAPRSLDDVEDPFPMAPREKMPWEPGWKPEAPTTAPARLQERGGVVANVAPGAAPAANDRFEKVPELGEVRLAAGEGIENENELATGSIQFRRSFLRSVGADGGRGRVVYAKGNSMEPEIKDGSALLFVPNPGLTVRDLIPNTVYAINYDGKMIVKTVTKDRLGRWVARSANSSYPDIALEGDAPVRILGPVVWAGGLLREGDAGQWVRR